MVISFLLTAILLVSSISYGITYNGYHTWAQGGTHIVAMGGAFAAVGDDSSCIWIAPAIIPLTNRSLDITFAQGYNFSSEFLPNSPTRAETTFSSVYNSISASYNWQNFSVAIADGDPFWEGPNNPSFAGSELRIHETRISYGSKINENVAAAILLVDRFAKERYSGYLDVNSQPAVDTEAGTKYDFGLSLAWRFAEHWTTSASFEQGDTFDFHNPSTLSFSNNGIQPVRIPNLTRIGLARAWPEIKLVVSSELDWWMDTQNLSNFIDSQFNGQQTFSTNSAILIPRLGAEHQILERTWMKSWVRGGYYVEQPRILQNRYREHWTVGLETKVWIVDFNLVFDHAAGYANAATSFGISLTDYQ